MSAPDSDSPPLGIIAGGGSLPCAVAAAAAAKGRRVHIVGIRGEALADIERYPHTWIKWGEVGRLFDALEDNKCRDLVIIGGVNRPDLANLKFDFGAIRTLPFILSLTIGGDDSVLSRVVRYVEGKGYRICGAGEVAPELLVPEGLLTRRGPTKEDEADIAAALKVVEALGRLDVGQAAVVSQGYVLAVEAAEGTDAMLERCVELRKRRVKRKGGRLGVLVKAPKPGQEERVDMPTIGPNTIRNAAAANLRGIAVAAGRVLMAERDATIATANELGLFLVGVEWPANADG